MLAAVSRVLLISLDGFASPYWTDARVRMLALRRRAERGVVARRMECEFPSTIWPTSFKDQQVFESATGAAVWRAWAAATTRPVGPGAAERPQMFGAEFRWNTC